MPYSYNTPDIFRRNDNLPVEDDSGVLSWLKHAGLGALGALGTVLDTPGSVVRGVLSGHPVQALEGIFDPTQRIHGKELLGIEDNPDSWWDDIGGIGAEIATDPLTFLTFGASSLGEGGKIAKAAGVLPTAERSGTQLIKGAAEAGVNSSLRQIVEQAPESLPQILQAAEGYGKPGLFKRGITKLTGHEFPAEDLAGAVTKGLEAAPGAGGIVDESLRAGFARAHVPFTDMSYNIGDSIAPQIDQFTNQFRYGNWLDAIPESVNVAGREIPIPKPDLDVNPIRRLAPYLQKASRGGKTALGQLTGQEAESLSRTNEAAMRGDQVFPLFEQWQQIPGNDTPEAIRALQDFVESNGSTAGQVIPTPFAESYAKTMGEFPAGLETERGIPLNELQDQGYMMRQQLQLPNIKSNPINSFGKSRVNDPSHESLFGREDFLRNQPTSALSQMSLDPAIVMPDVSPKDSLARILDNYGYKGYDPAEQKALQNEIESLRNQRASLREIPPADIANQELLDAGFDSSVLANDPLSDLWQQYREADITPINKRLGEAEQRATELEAAYKNAGKLQDWMQNSIGPKYIEHGNGFGVFDSNPIELVDRRLNRTANSIGEADALFNALPSNMVEGGGDNLVPLDKALERLGFASDGKVTDGAIAQIAKRIGKEFDPQTFSIPADVLEDLARVKQAFKAPEEISDFWKAIDKWTSFFKTYALMRPAFHTRNLVSGQVQNAMNGLFSPYATQASSKLLAGHDVSGLAKFLGWKMTDAEAAREVSRLAFAHDVISMGAGQVADLPGVVSQSILGAIPGQIPAGIPLTVDAAKGIGSSVLNTAKSPIDSLKQLGQWFKDKYQAGELNPLKTRGVVGDESKFVGSVAQEEAGHAIEGYNRLGGFIEGLRKGIDPETLAAKLREIQGDYSNLSTFERTHMRRGAPFYAFTRQMLPQVAGELAGRPGGPYGQLVRVMNDLQGDGQILPDHLKDTLAIPLGTNDQGDPRYITGLGLMPEDSFGLLGGLAGGGGLGSQLTGMLNPLIKGPLEAATGRSMFQDRELADQDPVLGRIFSNVFGGEPLHTNKIDQVLMNTIPSPLTVAKSLTDTRKGIGEKALNTLTGVKVTDVSPKQQEAMSRQYLQQYLKEFGGHNYEQTMLSKAEADSLPPDQKQKALAIQSLLKDLSNRAKQRAKAG